MKSALLIDVDAESIGGAYLADVGGTPSLLYVLRVPLYAAPGEGRKREALAQATLLGETMVRGGSEALREVTGSGHPEDVIVSFAHPWVRASKEGADHGFEFVALPARPPFYFSIYTHMHDVLRAALRSVYHRDSATYTASPWVAHRASSYLFPNRAAPVITPAHFRDVVRMAPTTAPDVPLALLAVFHAHSLDSVAV